MRQGQRSKLAYLHRMASIKRIAGHWLDVAPMRPARSKPLNITDTNAAVPFDSTICAIIIDQAFRNRDKSATTL
jgi:hypothetical protein